MNSAGPTPPVERFAVLPAFDGPQPEIRVYQLARPAIQFLTSLVEAAEGIGLVRTLDEQRGIVECWVMPDYRDDFELLITSVASQWPVQMLGREFE